MQTFSPCCLRKSRQAAMSPSAWSSGGGAGLGDAGLDAGVVVLGVEVALQAVEHGRRDRLVAHLGPALDVGAHVAVDAEDLLDHDHAALARR
jgi:hypothetical protein